MEKDKNIPEEASWNEEHKQWELDEKNAAGIHLGDYAKWDLNGNPIVKRVYNREMGGSEVLDSNQRAHHRKCF
jgi:hypothetical protein